MSAIVLSRTQKVVIVFAAAALLGAGFFAFAQRSTGNESASEGQQLSDLWAEGAHVAWNIPRSEDNPEYPLMASATQLMATSVDEDTAGGRTLIAYDVTGDQPSEAWRRDLVVDSYSEADFGFWADYFVYAGQIVDTESSELVAAPWAEDASVVLTPGMDMAIACDEESCAGYASPMEARWSIDMEDGAATPAVARGGEHFVLLYSEYASGVPAMVINAETGEEVTLGQQLTDVDTAVVLADGWMVLSYEGSSIVEPDGTVEILGEGPNDSGRMGITPGPNRTVDDIRWYNAADDSDAGRIVAQFDEGTCGFTVGGEPVTLSESGACDTPLQLLSTTRDGAAVAVLVQSAEGSLDYALVNVTSGEVVWRHDFGKGLRVARPDLAVTFDADGINGWAPGSE